MFLFVVVFSLTTAGTHAEPVVDPSYVAAVYEHHPILNPEPRVPLSRLDALHHLQKNLEIYEQQAAQAAQQVSKVCSFSDSGYISCGLL